MIRGLRVALAALSALALASRIAAAASPAAEPSGASASPSPSPLAEPGSPAWAESADVVEHLGDRLPPELSFVDPGGRRVTLGSLFDGRRPVLLVLAYYECPQLCSLVLDGATQAIRQLEPDGFALGQQYRAVTISFDATERVDQAARKQASVFGKLGVRIDDSGSAAWPFLVGDDASVRALTAQLGFHFLRDPRTGAIAHPAVAFVLTPDGAISRYLYGVDYPSRDLKLALLQASDGKTGSLGDRVLMRCFRYDPASRRYGLFVARFMELGGVVILAIVLAMFWVFAGHERRRARGELP
jgi:protein SCO1/2